MFDYWRVAIDNGHRKFVDVPIKHGAFPWLCGCLPEGNRAIFRFQSLDAAANTERMLRWRCDDQSLCGLEKVLRYPNVLQSLEHVISKVRKKCQSLMYLNVLGVDLHIIIFKRQPVRQPVEWCSLQHSRCWSDNEIRVSINFCWVTCSPCIDSITMLSGYWFQPLWKIVNWDDYSQSMEKKCKMFHTTNQMIQHRTSYINEPWL